MFLSRFADAPNESIWVCQSVLAQAHSWKLPFEGPGANRKSNSLDVRLVIAGDWPKAQGKGLCCDLSYAACWRGAGGFGVWYIVDWEWVQGGVGRSRVRVGSVWV